MESTFRSQDPAPEISLTDKDQLALSNLEAFFEIALDMLCISSSDGYFKRLNPAFSRTLGWSMEKLLSTPYIEMVHPDDVEPTLQEVQRQVALGEKVLYFENRYLHQDGSYRTLAWKSVPQPGGYMFAVARDVTEDRAKQKELQEKNRDLEQFSHAIAHDLRGPLRAIGGYTQIVLEDHGDQLPSDAQKDLDRVLANVERMGSMIDGLLRFSKVGIQELHKTSVDTEALVREAIAEVREMEPGRDIDFIVGALPTVKADAEMLKVVFTNLISNAVKYSRLKAKAIIEIGHLEKKSPATFFVRDNGAGFDMQHADKLFGVFQRMHPVATYEGNGIGLATVQRILTRHGGSIWAEGEVDQGATFYFTL